MRIQQCSALMPVMTLQSMLLLTRIWWPAQAEELVSTLTGCEDEARKGHTGIWIHGDPGSESDDEEASQKSAWGRR